MIIEQQKTPPSTPINLEKLNQFKLDNLIPKRNQFSNLRYQVITESLFFENKNIINDAVQILQEHKANIKPNQLTDYIPVAAQRFCQQLDQFTSHLVLDRKRFSQYEEKKSLLPISELKQIIQENLDEGVVQGNTKEKDVTPNLKFMGQSLVLELGFEELQDFRKKKILKDKEEYILEKLRQKIIIEGDNFWNKNDYLLKQYQQDIQQLLVQQQVPNDPILILLKGKKIKIEDYISFLERDFVIEGRKLVPYQFSTQALNSVKPMYECSKLHFNQNMLNCIKDIQQLERQSKFDKILSILSKFYQELSSFKTFKYLLELIDHSKSIVKWEQLLKTFFQEHEGYQKLSTTGIKRKSDSNLHQIRIYLDSCYSQLQGRFQDKFYDFKIEKQLQEFVDAPPFLINNNFNDQNPGHCAFEIFPNGLLLYFKLTINKGIGKDSNGQPLILLKKFSCYSLFHYSRQNLLKEGGELGQLILADKDEYMKVRKLNFFLKQQYNDSISVQLTKPEEENDIKNLIIEQYFISQQYIAEGNCCQNEANNVQSSNKGNSRKRTHFQ